MIKMSIIPDDIQEQLEEWSDKAEIDGGILEEQIRYIFDQIKKKASAMPDEEIWPIASDKLYGDEIRDILKSKAEMFVHMFIGVSALRDRNSWRTQEAKKRAQEDIDSAIEKGWVNEDGKPVSKAGRVLRPWWSRNYLAFSVKADDLGDEPQFNFFFGQLGGKQAQMFGKKKPRRGVDLRLRPVVGEWYRTRWTEQEDNYPVEIVTKDGTEIIFRTLGRSAKVTNFGMKEENIDSSGLKEVNRIAKNFPEELIIPIEKDGIDEWEAEHIIADTDDEGNDVLDYNAFGLIIGRLMQVNIRATFASIVLKSLNSDEEISIGCDPYTIQQVLDGVGTGSTLGAFSTVFKRKERDDDGNETGYNWEATGMGVAVLKLIPPLDLDDDDDDLDDDEDDDEDFIEDEIEEV
jgi:hypothetical protein